MYFCFFFLIIKYLIITLRFIPSVFDTQLVYFFAVQIKYLLLLSLLLVLSFLYSQTRFKRHVENTGDYW